MRTKLNRIGSDKNDPKLVLKEIAIIEPVGILQYNAFVANRDRFLEIPKKKEKPNGRKKHRRNV